VDLPQSTPVAELELRDAADQTVGTAEVQAGRDTMDWAWDLPTVQPVVKHQRVESAGVGFEGGAGITERQLSFADFTFDRAPAASSLVVRTVLPKGEFALYGGLVLEADGSGQQLLGRSKAKYRQVYVDSDIRVLENTAAMPRAIVVPRARVAPSLGTALSEMVHQPFSPDQDVILADDARTQATPLVTDRGGRGTARVTAYSADEVVVHTSASADAWLVLSDTFYPGWTATIDGTPAAVLRGDVLFRVVAIPGGEHDVAFRFVPASVSIGLPISVGSFALTVLVLAVAGGSAWRRRTTSR
jgi:hypothetical protein